jgi:general secretion pathway protein I
VRGFTLLEVMISLAIMAGVILTVISSFNYHLSVVDRDRVETVAIMLARAKLDDPYFKPADKKEGTFAPDRPDIAWKAEIEPLGSVPGVDRLTLTLSWDAGRRKISLEKYQAKK